MALLHSFASQVGDALAALLPADTSWTVEAPVSIDELGPPDDNWRALDLHAGDSAFAVLLHPALARQLVVGPPPAETLLEGIDAALTAAKDALASLVGGAAFGAPEEPTATAVLGRKARERSAVRLLDGERHSVTVIVESERDLDAVDDEPAAPTTTASAAVPIVDAQPASMLDDVQMGVTVELGRARLTVAEILQLTLGSVVELDRVAGAPVDVLVNGTLIARGEVVVVDEEFAVRVTEVNAEQSSDRRVVRAS